MAACSTGGEQARPQEPASTMLAAESSTKPPSPSSGPRYQQRLATRDGIGKVYMEREIAQVMGHQGAPWLERASREAEERPDLLIEALALEPDDVVADIGAGSGYFAVRIAPRVPDGRVLAVDIQPEMLALLEAAARDAGLENIEPIRGAVDSPRLPDGQVDLALFVDVYHELAFPHEMMIDVVRALKPGGRVVLVEYRAEDPSVPIKPLHKMSEAQARREMAAVGLTWQDTIDVLPRQHILIFAKASDDQAVR